MSDVDSVLGRKKNLSWEFIVLVAIQQSDGPTRLDQFWSDASYGGPVHDVMHVIIDLGKISGSPDVAEAKLS